MLLELLPVVAQPIYPGDLALLGGGLALLLGSLSPVARGAALVATSLPTPGLLDALAARQVQYHFFGSRVKGTTTSLRPTASSLSLYSSRKWECFLPWSLIRGECVDVKFSLTAPYPSLAPTDSCPGGTDGRRGDGVMGGEGLGDCGRWVLCAQALSCCISPRWYVSTSPSSRRAGTLTPWKLPLAPYRTSAPATGW